MAIDSHRIARGTSGPSYLPQIHIYRDTYLSSL